MKDTKHCPICNLKLLNSNKQIDPITKKLRYVRRICNGTNHFFQMHVDAILNRVDMLRVSLDPYYSKSLEVYYTANKSCIIYAKNSVEEVIKIDRILDIDFPDMLKLKEKVDTYLIFK
jgi:transcription elongation factor Elf1